MQSLHELLVDGTRFAPRYRPSMNSDHLPMTLCAMTGLGGDFKDCVAYRDDYKSILHEISYAPPLSDWRLGIGQRNMYPALFPWFREHVDNNGIESMVSQFLPDFISSLCMDAFHPLIRLGYAIDFRSEAETAAALAYIVSSHQHVPVDLNQTFNIDKEMRKQCTSGPRRFTASTFTGKIQELIAADNYPVGCANDISECAALALDIYRSTRDFFALHMVTATQAVRICSQFIDTKLAIASLTGGLLAAHRVVGSPAFDRDTPMPVPAVLDREHTYKYAWACLSEYRYYDDKRYADEIRDFRKGKLIPAWCANSVA